MELAPDDAPPPIAGRELRYLATLIIKALGPVDMGTIVHTIEELGVRVAGRPSKAISDGLRWEIAHQRVVRTGRSSYRLGRLPRSTEYDMRRYVERYAGVRLAPSP